MLKCATFSHKGRRKELNSTSPSPLVGEGGSVADGWGVMLATLFMPRHYPSCRKPIAFLKCATFLHTKRSVGEGKIKCASNASQTGDSLSTNDPQHSYHRKLSPLWWNSDERVWIISVAVSLTWCLVGRVDYSYSLRNKRVYFIMTTPSSFACSAVSNS